MNFQGIQPYRVYGSRVLIAWFLVLFGYGTSLWAADGSPIEIEHALITEARRAAGHDDFQTAMAKVFSMSGRANAAAPSVVMARRAVEVCTWLRNDNEYGRAMRVAERVLQRLSTMREDTDADRVERLYSESVLLADILDRKAEALALLQAAEALAPNDDRLLSRQLQLAEALAEFGR